MSVHTKTYNNSLEIVSYFIIKTVTTNRKEVRAWE